MILESLATGNRSSGRRLSASAPPCQELEDFELALGESVEQATTPGVVALRRARHP
jgi:hypothetical protein